jgi:peptidoglycan/LPS O-acetylase OafA/YrhL
MLAYNFMFVGLVGITILHAGHPLLGCLRMRWLAWLGKVSFGLYLIHHVLFVAIADLAREYGLPGRPLWLILPAIAASIVLAGISHRFLERPILGLKDRFPYRRVPNSHARRRPTPSECIPSAWP